MPEVNEEDASIIKSSSPRKTRLKLTKHVAGDGTVQIERKNSAILQVNMSVNSQGNPSARYKTKTNDNNTSGSHNQKYVQLEDTHQTYSTL